MTVANGKDGLRTFAGNDVSDTFPIDFGFDGAAALVVVLRGTADSLPAFTVNGTAAQMRAGEATITLTAVVPATGETLIVTRDTPAAQGSDYDDSAAFPSDDVEGRLDYLTRALGDLQRKLDRALLGDILDTSPFVFPAAAARAGNLLSFSDDGEDLETIHPVSGLVGPAFAWDAQGDLADRGDHDAEAEGFAYLATDQEPALLYIREGATAGVWSTGIPFTGAGDGTVIRVSASGVDAGDPDAIVLTTGTLPATKTDQVKLRFVPEAANTGPMTLEARKDVSTSWGGEAVVDRDGDPLPADTLVVGVPVEVVFSITLDAWVLQGAKDLTVFARLAARQAWAKVQRMGVEVVAYAATYAPDLDEAPLKALDALTGGLTLDLPDNCAQWDHFLLVVPQDGVGGRAITPDAGYLGAPTWSAAPGETDIVSCLVLAVSGTTATKVLMKTLFQGTI